MGSSLDTTSGNSWDRPRAARVGALAVAGGILLILIGWAVFGMIVPEQCSYQAIDGFTSFVLVSSSLTGFVAGHLLGRWFETSSMAKTSVRTEHIGASAAQVRAREVSSAERAFAGATHTESISAPSTAIAVAPPDLAPARPRAGQPTSGALLVQLGLVLLLGLSTVLLAYETLALVNTARNWPITYFVRCFASSNLWAAAIGAAAFCFLLGHWVWY